MSSSCHVCMFELLYPQKKTSLSNRTRIKTIKNNSSGLSSLILPAEHLDVVEARVVLQRGQLLQAQLLAASVEAVGAVDADAVVIATGAVLHGTQAWGTLWAEQRPGSDERGGILMDEDQQEELSEYAIFSQSIQRRL